jgi:hypothetical protein
MASKRQQTMAKVARERTVKEKRQRKLEKKQAKKLAVENGEPMVDDNAAELPPDLNARYVEGGPPEPTGAAVPMPTDAESASDAE